MPTRHRESWDLNGNYFDLGWTDFGPAIAVSGTSQTTSDVITSNYTKRRRNGEIIINPFSSVKTYDFCNIDGPVFDLREPDPDAHTTYTSVGAMVCNVPILNGVVTRQGDEPFDSEDVERLNEIAAVNAWQKVYDSEVQLQTSLLELKRTIQLLLNPIKSAKAFLKKVKADKDRDRASRALTLAQYIAKEWLTYRYGWSQLYRDFRGVLRAVGKAQRSGLQKGFGKHTEVRQWTEDWEASFNGGNFAVGLRKHTEQRITSRVGIFYDAELTVNSYLGLTKYDILSTLWDVVPFSFVVDWVANVQDYLGALLRKAGVPVRGVYTSTEKVTVVTWTIGEHRAVSAQYQSNGSTFVTECTGQRIQRTVEKSRIPQILSPSLHFDIKIGSLIDIRVADGIALILNLLGRR